MSNRGEVLGLFHDCHSAMRYLLDRVGRAQRDLSLPLLERAAVEANPRLVLPILPSPPLELLPGVSQYSFRTLADYRSYARERQSTGAAINLLPFPGIVHDSSSKAPSITTLSANIERIGPPADPPVAVSTPAKRRRAHDAGSTNKRHKP